MNIKKILIFNIGLVILLITIGCGNSSEPLIAETNSSTQKLYEPLNKYLSGKTFYSSNYVECNQTQLKNGCEDLNYIEKMVFNQPLTSVVDTSLIGYDKGDIDETNISVEEKKIIFLNKSDGTEEGYLELVQQTDNYLKFKDFNADGSIYTPNPEIILFLTQEEAQKHLNNQKMKYGGVANPEEITTLLGGKTFYAPLYHKCKDDEPNCQNIDVIIKVAFNQDLSLYTHYMDLEHNLTVTNRLNRNGDVIYLSRDEIFVFAKQTDEYLLFRSYNSQYDRNPILDTRLYFDLNKAQQYYNELKNSYQTSESNNSNSIQTEN